MDKFSTGVSLIFSGDAIQSTLSSLITNAVTLFITTIVGNILLRGFILPALNYNSKPLGDYTLFGIKIGDFIMQMLTFNIMVLISALTYTILS